MHRGAGHQRRRGLADGQCQSEIDLCGLRPACRRRGPGNQDRRYLVGRHRPGRFDFCCGEKEALEPAIEDATVAQFPTKMSELGFDAMVKAIKGQKVESLIDSGAALVTKENMAEFN